MSISEISWGKVEVYPNPSTSRFNIKINNLNHKDLNLIISDISGKIIYKDIIDVKSSKFIHQLNLQNVSKGTYFLRLNTNSEQAVQIISIL